MRHMLYFELNTDTDVDQLFDLLLGLAKNMLQEVEWESSEDGLGKTCPLVTHVTVKQLYGLKWTKYQKVLSVDREYLEHAYMPSKD